MQTVPQHPSSVEYAEDLRQALQRDCALRQAAEQARSHYAGEVTRIDKGLVIALNGGVTLCPDGTAQVQSARDPEVVYTVRRGVCDCPDFQRAPDGRCKHRYSVCLVKHAQQTLDQAAQQATVAADTSRYYASYTSPAGTTHQGIATRTCQGWLFMSENGLDPFYAATQALVFGGQVSILESQRVNDGDLVRKVCGY